MKFLIILLITWTAFAADTKPKYGPEATTLSESNEYFRQSPAPDFWALIPYYAAQQTGSACSIASVAMVVNGARVGQKLSSDEELVTQNNLLKKAGDRKWTRSVGNHGGGVILDELGPLIEKSLKAHGFVNAKAEVVHTPDASDTVRARLRESLTQNETSRQDFIVINFLQGAYTGDADVGHIAPVGAYDEKTRRVLVMDPDREWYEPYWVSEETLLKGMTTKDRGTGKARGYVHVKVR